MTTTIRRLLFVVLVVLMAAPAWSAEKTWKTGTWRDAKVERPKVVFGIAPNTPNTGVPRSSTSAMERRTYVIETETERLEIRQDATVDTPRIDALVGEPVTFAVDKNDIWIKDSQGREHRMKVTKKVKTKN